MLRAYVRCCVVAGLPSAQVCCQENFRLSRESQRVWTPALRALERVWKISHRYLLHQRIRSVQNGSVSNQSSLGLCSLPRQRGERDSPPISPVAKRPRRGPAMQRRACLGLKCSVGASGDHSQRIENDRQQWPLTSLPSDKICLQEKLVRRMRHFSCFATWPFRGNLSYVLS
jgi:hypothetical protein